MFGLQFIIRVLEFIAVLLISAVLLVLVITAINKLIQFVGNMLGYNVGNFWGWLKEKLPAKKPKRRSRKKVL